MNMDHPTILVVDDTPENIDILRNILHKEYKIKAALSGERALAIVRSDPKPDMILLDIMMPDLDGYEVCRQIKADPLTADIPIIFVTAMNSEANEEKGLALGALDYITKPINAAITKARIKTHLSMRCLFERKSQYEKQLFEEYRNKSINELMVNISHHWRQPLNVIAMEIENIRIDMEDSGIESDQINHSLEGIKKHVFELSRTIDFFKKYSPGKSHAFSTISPRKVVEDISTLAEEKISASSLTIINNIPEELTIVSEPSILLNVLLTLLENSVDIALERQVSNPTLVFEGSQNASVVQLRVYDNAGGIDVQPPERVFDPYFTTFFKSRDKGLGLYMAKIGIEKHLKGTLGVENNGTGALFILNLDKQTATENPSR